MSEENYKIVITKTVKMSKQEMDDSKLLTFQLNPSFMGPFGTTKTVEVYKQTFVDVDLAETVSFFNKPTAYNTTSDPRLMSMPSSTACDDQFTVHPDD